MEQSPSYPQGAVLSRAGGEALLLYAAEALGSSVLQWNLVVEECAVHTSVRARLSGAEGPRLASALRC